MRSVECPKTGTFPKYPVNSTPSPTLARFLLEEAALGFRLIRYSVSPRGASPAGDTRRKVRRAGSSFRNSAPGEASAARIPESDREKKLRTRRARARAIIHREKGRGEQALLPFFSLPFSLARAAAARWQESKGRRAVSRAADRSLIERNED